MFMYLYDIRESSETMKLKCFLQSKGPGNQGSEGKLADVAGFSSRRHKDRERYTLAPVASQSLRQWVVLPSIDLHNRCSL